MRSLLLVLFVLTSTATLAAEWGHYDNERFGLGVDVPPGFVPGSPPDNGDGQAFSTSTAKLSAFGSLMTEGDFESEVDRRIAWREGEGWVVTYKATTPSWASFSGRKGGRIFYDRAIPLCGGSAIGMFSLEYSAADGAAFDAVVERLVPSLRDGGNGWGC